MQDTTTLNYNGLTATRGLVGFGGGGAGSEGILAHLGLAVSAAGRPLTAGRLRARHHLPRRPEGGPGRTMRRGAKL